MAAQGKTTDLLEHLAQLAGCDYLSDLGNPRFLPALHEALARTPLEDYPDAQWREAVRYLLRREEPGAGEARQALLRASARG